MTMSKKNASSRANAIMDDANREAQVLKEKKLLEAREEAMKVMADAERNASQKMQKAQAGEARVKQRELQLNQTQSELAKRKNELDALRNKLEAKEQSVEARSEELNRLQLQAQEELEHISGLSAEEAKEKLIESLKDEAKTAAAGYINDIMDDAKMTASNVL
jgi:ribonuclease Y